MNIRNTLFFIVMLAIFASCKDKGATAVDLSQQPVVTVKGKTLYQSDVNEILPGGITAEDSTAIAQEYIRKWIDNELMHDKAKQNIVNKAQIDELVENYKRSLIVNTYQEQLIKEELSKTVSEAELKSYYDQNADKFALDESIIKGLYLKVPVGSAQLKDFQKWYKQSSEAAVENIEKITLKGAVGYEYFYDKWIAFDEVMENIPFVIDDDEQFLKTNKSFEKQDSSFVYMLNIKEYQLKGSPAPYDFIKSRLRDVFLERKKNSYLEQVGKDLYDKALSEGEIKFYAK